MFFVTKCARKATKIGGNLGRPEKAATNRRNRRRFRAHLQAFGAEADCWPPKLYTGWDVI